jgi:hypothetical protein
LFSYVDLEARVRREHALRAIREIVNAGWPRWRLMSPRFTRLPMLGGRDRVGWAFTFAAAAYNLVRLPKLWRRQRIG